MTCFHPLKAAWKPEDGTKPIIYSKAKPRPSPLTNGYEPLDLPCNQCEGCRIRRSQEWAARIVHESQMHRDNCFVTLTYDSENVPANGSLNKRHFQLFMKRLRKHHEGKTIRYFHCGEYGEELQRPHYHACLFGIDFIDRVEHSANHRGDITYTSQTLENIWGMGFCTIGELNYETAAYTARYVMKKITGKRADKHYARVNPITERIELIQPEYATMSLRPALGKSFYDKYKSDFFPRDECPIPGRGVYNSVPTYYETLLKEEDPDTYEQVKRARKEYRDTHECEYTPKRLKAKETVKQAQLSQLKRS